MLDKLIVCGQLSEPVTSFVCQTLLIHRGLAAMRPACHLDTQNTVFWQFGHPKVYVRICWRWLFLEDRRCRSCSVTFIRHTKQYLTFKSKICKGIGSILLVVCILYHTLDTQKSMKPVFGHPVSEYRLRPCSYIFIKANNNICVNIHST